MSSKFVLSLVIFLVYGMGAHARDLVIHVDLLREHTITRDLSSEAFQKNLRALNPDRDILTLKLSGPPPSPRPGDVSDNIRADLTEALEGLLREHAGGVAMVVLDGDGVLGYVHTLGGILDYGKDGTAPTLAETLAPLKGRMNEDASFVFTAGRMVYEASRDEFVRGARKFLIQMGAPRGSLFAMSTLWEDIPSWTAERLRTARIGLGAGLGVLWAVNGWANDPATAATAYFAALGAPLLYLSTWPLYGKVGSAFYKSDRTNAVALLGAVASVLAIQAAWDLKLAVNGFLVSLGTYTTLSVAQFIWTSVPRIREARRGEINTGIVFSLRGGDVLRETSIRADRAWRRIFSCESDLNDNAPTLDLNSREALLGGVRSR